MGIPVEDITGLVLAGGRGIRMGGVDKGLQNHRGIPLALHALLRLQAQVGQTMLNANRNLGAYESFGVPVWPDTSADYPGPLAGVLAGLERCETPYLVTVPCDTPNFPDDLVARLAEALQAEDAEIAMAAGFAWLAFRLVSVGLWGPLPFVLLFGFGFGYVGVGSLTRFRFQRRHAPA